MAFHNTPKTAEVVLLNISDIHLKLQKLQTESHHTYNFKYYLKKEKENLLTVVSIYSQALCHTLGIQS